MNEYLTEWEKETVFRDRVKRTVTKRNKSKIFQFVEGYFSPLSVYLTGRKKFKIVPGTYNGGYPLVNGVSILTQNEFVQGVDFLSAWTRVLVYVVYDGTFRLELLEYPNSPSDSSDFVLIGDVNFDNWRMDGDQVVHLPEQGSLTILIDQLQGDVKDYVVNWVSTTGADPVEHKWRNYETIQT